MSDEAALHVRRILQKMDCNGDGKLSKSELLKVLSQLMPGEVDEGSIDGIFAEIDANENGCLTFEEFLDWAFNCHEAQKTANRRFRFDLLEDGVQKSSFHDILDEDIGDDDSEDEDVQDDLAGQFDIQVGDWVKVKDDIETPKKNWGKVCAGDVGVVVKVNVDYCRVNFPRQSNWLGYLPEMEKVDGQVAVGDRVRVHPSLSRPKHNWGRVHRGEVGVVQSVDGESCRVDFPSHSNWLGCVSEMQKMTEEAQTTVFPDVGSQVRVKAEVETPKYQWGKVRRGEVGTVTRIWDGDQCKVDFPSHENWGGWLPDLEVAPEQPTLEVGAKVCVKSDVDKPKYNWGQVRKCDIGTITEIWNKYDCRVDFKRQKQWRGWLPDLELATADDGEQDDEWEEKGFVPGALVTVKADVETPKYNWGKARHGMQGRIRSVDGDNAKVEFPAIAKPWLAYLPDMELIADDDDVASEASESDPGETFEDGLKEVLDDKDRTWKRCQDIGGTALFADVSPNDIHQGKLGDCWLLAGFSSLAEFPESLSILFKRKELSKKGRYSLRLFDLNTSSWKKIRIDDKLPVTARSGNYTARYAGITEQGAVWCALLEKACAVLYCSYDGLRGGWGPTCWATLLGCQEGFSMKKYGDMWKRRKMIWTSNDSYKANWSRWPDKDNGQTEKNAEELFDFMSIWDSKNYLMSASSHVASDDSKKVENIVQSHEYSLVRVANDPRGSGLKLVQLRNPWGNTEWQGAWSDEDDTWDSYPDVKEELKLPKKNDGLFWMSLDDFVRIFDYVCVMEREMPRGTA
eukprot:TRINITY_DN62145_c0_g1_i1.p1 TRINITY_DN62145_c0_g1~~TRINITY_DN62145_c0_g1_i1.p1  ORF type:complete len:796 (+),score=164.02 TRINITY_DN62145_c0_g1_i1:60-2447(+)